MRNLKCGLSLVVLSCWMSAAMADNADAAAASGVPAAPEAAAAKTEPPAAAPAKTEATPDEDFQAGLAAAKHNDAAKAKAAFERAANGGHAGAMARLAEMLEKSGNMKDALEWDIKAAGLGNADAQYTIGRMYSDMKVFGDARSGVKVDPVIAYKWFKMSAEGGNKSAIGLIAQVYVSGGDAVGIKDADRTDAEVLRWIKEDISANNNPASMQTLAAAYRDGKLGLTADAKQASDWEAKAKAAEKPKKSPEKKKKKRSED